MKTIKLEPCPAKPVRMITTAEGKFLSLADLKDRISEQGVLDHALSLFVVGKDKGDDARQIMRYAFGSLIKACAGE